MERGGVSCPFLIFLYEKVRRDYFKAICISAAFNVERLKKGEPLQNLAVI
jgi:hypothetical protein